MNATITNPNPSSVSSVAPTGVGRPATLRRRSRTSRRLDQAIIARLAEGSATPAQLAAELDIPLGRLAEWCAKPVNLRIMASLARLADVRAQMIVSTFRANAA